MAPAPPEIIKMKDGKIKTKDDFAYIVLDDGRQYRIDDLVGKVIKHETRRLPGSKRSSGVRYTKGERIWIANASQQKIIKKYGLTPTQANSLRYNSQRYLQDL